MASGEDGEPPSQRSAVGRSTRRGHEFTALDPKTGRYAKAVVRQNRLQHLAGRGAGALLEVKETVARTLEAPTAVFEGIRWDDDEAPGGDGWRCYVARPNQRFDHQTGRITLPAQDAIFLVFLNDEGVAYNWRWESADDTDAFLPRSSDNRFREQVYP